MEALAENRAEGNCHHRKNDKRNMNSEEGNSAPPPTAISVASVTYNRSDEQNETVGQGGDEQTGDKIRSAKLLKEKLHDAGNGAVAHRPGDVAPKEPEGEGGESDASVGEGSYLPFPTAGGR